jgi:hypothetical protein
MHHKHCRSMLCRTRHPCEHPCLHSLTCQQCTGRCASLVISPPPACQRRMTVQRIVSTQMQAGGVPSSAGAMGLFDLGEFSFCRGSGGLVPSDFRDATPGLILDHACTPATEQKLQARCGLPPPLHARTAICTEANKQKRVCLSETKAGFWICLATYHICLSNLSGVYLAT